MQFLIKRCEEDTMPVSVFSLAPLRKRAKLTQKQVAEKMGKSTSWVCELEHDKALWCRVYDIAAYSLACGYILDIVFTNADGSLDKEGV